MSQTAISSTSKRSKRSRSTVLVIGILSLANNTSDWWIITFTPFSSDQMIRNLSMKIGEVDSGSATAIWLNLSQPHQFSFLNFLAFGRC